jgi:hypothetical protein
MLAEYTIKFTLDNGDSFAWGIAVGGLVAYATVLFMAWWDKQ